MTVQPIEKLVLLFGLAMLPAALPGQIETGPTLTLDGARQIMAAATSEVRRLGVGSAVAVVDQGGHLICLERLDDTFSEAARIATGKARTAAVFEKPTAVFERLINEGRTTMVTLSEFTPLQGGIPISVDGRIVGAIGVSGAASAQQDEEIAQVGAAVAGSFFHGDS